MALSLLMLANPNNWAAAPVLAAPSLNGGPSLYQPGGRHRSVSAALALGGAALVLAGLMTALVAPEILKHSPPPIVVINYPMPVPPPPQPQPNADPRNDPVLTTARPRVDIPTTIKDPIPSVIEAYIPPLGGAGAGIGGGTGTGFEENWGTGVTVPPLITAARRDPRYASSFQPPYPAAKEHERETGRCPVSVTIAPSGRVTAVRDMGCTDPAFYRTTMRQALSRWRFEPATRDGVAVESTLSQTVIFRLPE